MMTIEVSLFFLALSFFCFRYQKKINALTHRHYQKLSHLIQRPMNVDTEVQSKFISLFLSFLKGGSSIEIAREEALTLLSEKEKQYVRSSQGIIEKFILSAIQYGSRITPIFTLLKKNLDHQTRFQKNVSSVSAQMSLQTTIICLIPILLFIALCFLDYEWTFECLKNRISLVCFCLSLSLTSLSFFWISKIKLHFLTNNSSSKIQKLPNFILHTVLFLSSGNDAESAHQQSMNEQDLEFQKALLAKNTEDEQLTPFLNQYSHLLNNSIQHGSPIIQDLFQIIDDIYFHIQLRSEENLKKLPVYLLAPLFLCSFPSCALVLVGILYPRIASF